MSVSEGENVLTLGLVEFNKKWLVQRKTQLSFIIVMYLISLIAVTAALATSMPQQVGDNMTTTASYYYYRVKLGFTAPIWLCWGVLVLARFYWNNYQVSSRVVLASYLLKVITPIFILFVPFRDYFDSEMSTSNVLIQVGILALLLQIAFQSLLPALFIAHTSMANANSLSILYNSPEFKIVSATFGVFYIPIILISFGVIFQIDSTLSAIKSGNMNQGYDYKIVGIMILYILGLSSPVVLSYRAISYRWSSVITFCIYFPLLVILILFAEKYGYSFGDLVQFYFNGYVSGIYTNLFVTDVLVTVVTTCAGRNEHNNKVELDPRNLYLRLEPQSEASESV